jgi:hypothetical protein
MDARAERLARNEALYRDVNERLKGLGDSTAQKALFVCECGRADCVDRISVSLREYEDVRQEPTHFVVRKGHEMPDVHNVVAESDRFVVVQKRPGGPAEFAAEHDPRS